MPLSNRELQAAYAARQRAAGRTQRKIWAHDEDWQAIREFVRGLNQKREQSNEQRISKNITASEK